MTFCSNAVPEILETELESLIYPPINLDDGVTCLCSCLWGYSVLCRALENNDLALLGAVSVMWPVFIVVHKY